MLIFLLRRLTRPKDAPIEPLDKVTVAIIALEALVILFAVAWLLLA